MKKILNGTLVAILRLAGCQSTKKYHATFSKVGEVDYKENGNDYVMVIHEGDELTFSKLIE